MEWLHAPADARWKIRNTLQPKGKRTYIVIRSVTDSSCCLYKSRFGLKTEMKVTYRVINSPKRKYDYD